MSTFHQLAFLGSIFLLLMAVLVYIDGWAALLNIGIAFVIAVPILIVSEVLKTA